jgi:hypothetical protein
LALIVAGGYCIAVLVLLGVTVTSAYLAQRVLRSAAVTAYGTVALDSQLFWQQIDELATFNGIAHHLLMLTVPLTFGLPVVAASVWIRARSQNALWLYFQCGLRLASYTLPPMALVWAVSLVAWDLLYAVCLTFGWHAYLGAFVIPTGMLGIAVVLCTYLAIPMKLYLRSRYPLAESFLTAGAASVGAAFTTLRVLMALHG